MPTLAAKSETTAVSQPNSAPATRVTTSCTSSSEAKPSASDVTANDVMISESKSRCEEPRWMKSVRTYGAFGRKSSQASPRAANWSRERRLAHATTSSAASPSGIQASARFQTSPLYSASPYSYFRTARSTTHHADAANSAPNG